MPDSAQQSNSTPQFPTDKRPNRNVEIKARVADLDKAREIAKRLATDRLADQHQIDTYFQCQEGRLKLREINGQSAQLIWYIRPNSTDARQSEYYLIDVSQPAALKRALSSALGVRGVVAKRREIYLYENVRIHLDQVQGLGTFLEFEAVLGPGETEAAGHEKVAFLSGQFNLSAKDLLATSYGEMT